MRIGYSVHQKSAHPVVPLEHGREVARLVELRRAGEPRGPRAHDGHLLSRSPRGGAGDDPPLLESPVHYGALYALYRHGGLVYSQNAGSLAGGGAYPPRELGEVVGLVKPLESLPPESRPHEIVPLGYEVVYGTSRGHSADYLPRLAERHAAVHAAGSLQGEILFRKAPVKLLPVAYSSGGGAVLRQLSSVLHKTRGVAHHSPSSVRSVIVSSRSRAPGLSCSPRRRP